jgi:DNA-binding Xre family transcriptional regulator
MIELSEESMRYARIGTIHSIYAAVVMQVAKGQWSTQQLADRLGLSPKQIKTWLASPNGWTLRTVSDLCLAMDCEIDARLIPFSAPEPPTTGEKA